MKIAITGASGFVGQALTKSLEISGYLTIPLSAKDCKDAKIISQKISGVDAIINLAGAPIIKRWSEEYQKILIESRVGVTKRLVEAVSMLEEKPNFLFSTSAVGYYASNKLFDEDGERGSGFLAKLCNDWEQAAFEAKEHGLRVCVGRFGIVLGKNGGALSQMLPIFKLGLGGIIASGTQPMSWLYLDDLVGAILFLLNRKDLSGVFNFASPNAVTNREFTKVLGEVLHRPTFFPVPEFALKLLYSDGAKVLIDGQIAYPKRLLENGFVFEKSNLKEALIASVL